MEYKIRSVCKNKIQTGYKRREIFDALPVGVFRMGAGRKFDLLVGAFESDVKPSQEGMDVLYK